MKLSVFIVFLVFLSHSESAVRGRRIQRVVRNGGENYIFSMKQTTWDNAEKRCNSFQGARLLSIETKEESQFVLGMINNDELFDPPLPLGTTFWTSGKYIGKNWVWSAAKGTPKFGKWTRDLWAAGEPSSPIRSDTRVVMERNNLNHSAWKTYSATTGKAFYICEL